jgi:DNA-binding response OmpR family regulator
MKIVLATAATTAADRQRGVDCGSDDFIAKPFALAQMKAKVDSIVLEARGGEANAGLRER